MLATLEYEQGSITYDAALDLEDNVINRLAHVPKAKQLNQYLWEQRATIEALVIHHLNLRNGDDCTVLGQHAWIQGSFNICIPVAVISERTSRKVIMRCPMPHKLAESRYPGTVDEKLSCEVGMYMWMQHHCTDVPIPHLFGFGFPQGGHFTHTKHRPFYIRFVQTVRRYLSALLRYPMITHYTLNPTAHDISTGYMVLDFVEPSTGRMLSNTWEDYRKEPVRKQNLYRGIARLVLSLAHIPQPNIGSFCFHGDGTIRLTNRPLSCSLMILENDGAPRTIERNDTYINTDAFVSDMLTFHDNRFLTQPNAVNNERDCRGQMAVKTLLRALSHNFYSRERRNGPFVLQFTDFHASNIFVDHEWNITCLIDLEWICSLPVEMLAMPYWLTGKGIDEITDNHLIEFEQVRKEFMHIFSHEEQIMSANKKNSIALASIMDEMWDTKGVWFWYCIESVNAMYFLLESHLCPSFSANLSSKTEEIISQFWSRHTTDIVAKKVDEKKRYDQDLRCLFEKEALLRE